MSLIGKIGTCAFDAQTIHRGVYFDFRGDRLDASTWIECVPEGLRDAAKYIANRAEYRHSGMVASIDTLDSIRDFMASEAIRLVELGALTRDGFTHPDKLNSKEKTNMDGEEIRLAKELVEHPDWTWIAGMRYVFGHGYDQGGRIWDSCDVPAPDRIPGAIPDLSDAATIGCIILDIAKDHRVDMGNEGVDVYARPGALLSSVGILGSRPGAAAAQSWIRAKAAVTHAITLPSRATDLVTKCGVFVRNLPMGARVDLSGGDRVGCPRCREAESGR